MFALRIDVTGRRRQSHEPGVILRAGQKFSKCHDIQDSAGEFLGNVIVSASVARHHHRQSANILVTALIKLLVFTFIFSISCIPFGTRNDCFHTCRYYDKGTGSSGGV